MPYPNVSVLADLRWMSNRSPFGKRRSSRLADADEEQHRAARGHRSARGAPRRGDAAADVRRGRLEAEELLDRVGDERAVVDELATLVGVVGQDLARPSRSGASSSRCRHRRPRSGR